MGAIRAKHYGEEEQRLMETDAVKEMAKDIQEGIALGKITDWDTDSFGWLQRCNARYQKVTGDYGAHLGAVQAAVNNLMKGEE